MEFKLSKPVQFEDKRFESLTLREPTAGEIEKAQLQAEKYGFTLSLISQVADIPIGAVDMMGQRETEEIAEFIEEFIADLSEEVESSPAEFILRLKEPITLADGLTFTEFELREPINSERRQAAKAEYSFAIAIAQISLVAKVPKAAVRKMTATDFSKALQYFQGFSSRRLKTGKK